MAFFNTVMEASEIRAGAYEAAMEDVGKMLGTLTTRAIPGMKQAFGEVMQPAIYSVLKVFYELAIWLEKSPGWFKAAVVGALTFVTTMAAVATVVGTVTLAIKGLSLALGTMLGPVGLVLAAVSALVTGWMLYKNATRESSDAVDAQKKKIEERIELHLS